MAHDHDEDTDQSVLEETVNMIQAETKRLFSAVALSSVKDALRDRVFPILTMLAEAVNDEVETLRAEIFGDDEDDGVIDEVNERLDTIEERFGVALVGLETRHLLQNLARSVETYCSDKQNVLQEAQQALAYVSALEQQAMAALQAAREAEGQTDMPQQADPTTGQPLPVQQPTVVQPVAQPAQPQPVRQTSGL